MSASSSARGGKERELAPHLQTASSRSSAATNGSSGRGERREPREPGKRRVGESDDWRRGEFMKRGCVTVTNWIAKPVTVVATRVSPLDSPVPCARPNVLTRP
jgi:hypothetical protein